MIPVTKERLLEVLDDIRSRVANGDSFEGSIRYLLPEDPEHADDFMVEACYRVGNSAGQGGMRMIGLPRADD